MLEKLREKRERERMVDECLRVFEVGATRQSKNIGSGRIRTVLYIYFEAKYVRVNEWTEGNCEERKVDQCLKCDEMIGEL